MGLSLRLWDPHPNLCIFSEPLACSQRLPSPHPSCSTMYSVSPFTTPDQVCELLKMHRGAAATENCVLALPHGVTAAAVRGSPMLPVRERGIQRGKEVPKTTPLAGGREKTKQSSHFHPVPKFGAHPTLFSHNCLEAP